MEDWVHRALARWPNVPALFGWLGLDRRGRWLIRGEIINRPQIIDTINRNYAADEHGRWYFQNGPQRGYVAVEYTPLILRAEHNALVTHTGLHVEQATQAYLDEEGALLFVSEHGPGVLDANDLEWALQRITTNGKAIDEAALAEALSLPSGTITTLSFTLAHAALPLARLDAAQMPQALGFVREPQPRDGEHASS